MLARPLRSVDAATSWFGFRKCAPWVWTEEAVEVVGKWDNVRQREEELDCWIREAEGWIGRLEVAVGIRDSRDAE